MKYKELLNFEPITEVVKFSRTSESDYQKSLIKTFVFSDTFKNHLIPLMIRNLDFNYSGESFGLQVVGNYFINFFPLRNSQDISVINIDISKDFPAIGIIKFLSFKVIIDSMEF
jgi:hypothetical protein